MLRAIRVLAVAGLVFVALGAWMAYAHVVDVSAQGDIAPRFAFTTGTLLSFAAGVLTLALTIPRRQRPWSAALLASLILNAYWSLAVDSVLVSTWSLLSTVVYIVSFGLPSAAPALLALGYTLRAARPAVQAAPAAGEPGSLDITIEPMGSRTR